MTEQLVNLNEEDNFYKNYIENGTTTQKGVSLSRATSYLGKAQTISKYYKTNLNNIRRANTPLLKEIWFFLIRLIRSLSMKNTLILFYLKKSTEMIPFLLKLFRLI